MIKEGRTFRILHVEDNPGDVHLLAESLRECPFSYQLSVVNDGENALRFLRGEEQFQRAARPDLVLLDLNLPRKNGREVLAEVKADPELRQIPIVILTSSSAAEEAFNSYDLHANGFITKPATFDEFNAIVRAIERYWFSAVTLPRGDP